MQLFLLKLGNPLNCTFVSQFTGNKTHPIRVLEGWSKTHANRRGENKGVESNRIHTLVVIVLLSSLALLLILACVKKKYDLRKHEKFLLEESSLLAQEELNTVDDEGRNLTKDINQLI